MAQVTWPEGSERPSTVAWFGGRRWLRGDAFEGVVEQYRPAARSVPPGVGHDGGPTQGTDVLGRSSNLVARMPQIVRLTAAAGVGSGTEVASDLEFPGSARSEAVCLGNAFASFSIFVVVFVAADAPPNAARKLTDRGRSAFRT